MWITCLTQLARWRPSMRMCPILTSTTSQGAIFIISPILHNLTSITFQGAILCGHNFPIHPILMCYQPRFELQGGVGRLDPLLRAKLPGKSHLSIWRWLKWSIWRGLNLSVWRWLQWQRIHNQTITDDCLSNDPPNAKEESYKQVTCLDGWKS